MIQAKSIRFKRILDCDCVGSAVRIHAKCMARGCLACVNSMDSDSFVRRLCMLALSHRCRCQSYRPVTVDYDVEHCCVSIAIVNELMFQWHVSHSSVCMRGVLVLCSHWILLVGMCLPLMFVNQSLLFRSVSANICVSGSSGRVLRVRL